jgi:ABC-type Co2+ transport system permease subunit
MTLASLTFASLTAPAAFAAGCVQGSDYSYLSSANASPVIIRFTNTTECDFTLPAGLSTFAEVVVVGAGGGGGTDGGSGGGGGEVRSSTSYSISGISALRIAVGVGGNSGIWGTAGGTPRSASSGTASYIKRTDNTTLLLANGGGAGNGWGGGSATAGGVGGSGGSGGSGTNGQTGGAGAAGCTSTSVTLGGSPSGTLFSTSITGTAIDFGGGGGGGNATNVWNASLRTLGRAGGGTSGGAGANYGKALDGTDIQGSSRGGPGRANSGGGGGGGTACDSYGAYGSTLTSAVTVDGVTYPSGTTVDGSLQRTNGGQGANGVVLLSFAKITPTFSAWSGVTKNYGDASYSVAAPTVTNSLAGTFTYASGTTSVISVSGTTLNVVGGGSATITATFTPTDTTNYTTATTTHTVTVNKINQTLTFGTTSYAKKYNETQSVLATAPGAGSITYSAGSSTACSVNSLTGIVTITASSGTCIITASIATDQNYNLANSSNSVSITVRMASSTVNLGIATGALLYRQAKVLTATVNTAGRLTFRANKVVIAGCKNLLANSSTSFSRTCNYRPAVNGYVTLTVSFSPINSEYIASTTSTGLLFVSRRTNTR